MEKNVPTDAFYLEDGINELTNNSVTELEDMLKNAENSADHAKVYLLTAALDLRTDMEVQAGILRSITNG